MENILLEAVEQAVQQKKYLKIQYRTELHEYLSVTSLIKRLFEQEGALYLELATGQEIPFAQLVKVGDVASDNYNSRDFTCDC